MPTTLSELSLVIRLFVLAIIAAKVRGGPDIVFSPSPRKERRRAHPARRFSGVRMVEGPRIHSGAELLILGLLFFKLPVPAST